MRQSTLSRFETTGTTDDSDGEHPAVPDGLPYDDWDEVPIPVRNNIRAGGRVTDKSLVELLAEGLSA